MTQEEWRPVVGYEGLYEVSDCGNVRSVDRTIVNKNGITRLLKGKLIHPIVSGSERKYLQVHLSKNNKQEHVSVHRLVARAFVDGYEPHLTIDHVNGNSYDNRAENLCWCTQRENNLRAIKLGLAKPEKLTASVQTKEFRRMMSDVKRKPVIRDDGQVFSSARAASITLGLQPASVSSQIRGHCKTAGGHTFRYLTPQERVKYSI